MKMPNLHERNSKPWSVNADVNWDLLAFDTIAPVVRGPMADAYAHILQAEMLGLKVVRRLVDVADEGPLRDFARSQMRDEVRHVDFFSRVSAGLGERAGVSPSLAMLDVELSSMSDYTSIMTLAQVMENAANALFNGHARQSLRLMKRNVRLPGSAVVEALLIALSRLVGRDESMHVALGMRVLRSRYAGITARERHVLEERVQAASALMQAAFGEVGRSYQRLGFGERELLDRIGLAQKRYWGCLDIEAHPAARSGGNDD